MIWPDTGVVTVKGSDSEAFGVVYELVAAVQTDFLPQEGFQQVYAVFIPLPIPWLPPSVRGAAGALHSSTAWVKEEGGLITLTHSRGAEESALPFLTVTVEMNNAAEKTAFQSRLNKYLQTKTEEIHQKLNPAT